MAYFPFFVNLEGQRGLIAGGGRVALAKAERLLDYGPALTVVAPRVLPALAEKPGVTAVRREFQADDLKSPPLFVVAATGNAATDGAIARLCREKRIPVNAVDLPGECTFFFPALLRRGKLSIGVSTGGASPTAAQYLRQKINETLPEQIGEILDFLQRQRERVKAGVAEETARKAIFQALFAECLRLDRPLTAEETETIIKNDP